MAETTLRTKSSPNMTDKKAFELMLKHREKLMQLAQIMHSESILFGVAAIDTLMNQMIDNYKPKTKENAKQSTNATRRGNGSLRTKRIR